MHPCIQANPSGGHGTNGPGVLHNVVEEDRKENGTVNSTRSAQRAVRVKVVNFTVASFGVVKVCSVILKVIGFNGF